MTIHNQHQYSPFLPAVSVLSCPESTRELLRQVLQTWSSSKGGIQSNKYIKSGQISTNSAKHLRLRLFFNIVISNNVKYNILK